MRTIIIKFGAWLCNRGLHSWKLEQVQDDPRAWNLYLTLNVCQRCGLKRTEDGDMTDQMPPM